MKTYRLLKMDEVNKNELLVPTSEIRDYLHNVYDGNPILCNYDKPYSESRNVNLNTVSHFLYNLRMRDLYLVGDIETLDTHYGNILKNLIENGTIEFPACYHGEITIIDGVKTVTNITSITCFPSDNLAFI